MEQFSLVIIIMEKTFSVTGSFAGTSYPSPHLLALFGPCLLLATRLLVYIKYYIYSLELGAVRFQFGEDICTDIIIKCL